MSTPSAPPSSRPLPTILPLGALIQSFPVGAKNHNIVLNFDTPQQYASHNSPYFGETIGRVANRISGASIESLNGRDYRLTANNGPNTLHGGVLGWGKREWTRAPTPEQRQDADGTSREAQVYTLRSEDGEEGFPGAVECRTYYMARREVLDGRDTTILEIEYEVQLLESDGPQDTVVAVTNHSYFNVTSGPDVRGTRCSLASGSLHLVVDEVQIPTGEIAPFPGLPGAAGQEFSFDADGPRVDHCLVMADDAPSADKVPLDTRGRRLREQVRFTAPDGDTGITLVVSSTEPAFQMYTGDGIDIPAVGNVPARKSRAGIAIEPSRFVNAVNGKSSDGKSWRNQVLLTSGQTYGSRIRYTAWAA